MKCPHCEKDTRGQVTASRRVDGDVWRMRYCNLCLKDFVSKEMALKEAKFPWDAVMRKRKELKPAEEKPVQKQNKWVFPDRLW